MINTQTSITRALLYIPVIAGGLVLLIGVAVTLSWIIQLPLLLTLLPDLASMKFNTALCFCLCGIALLFYNSADQQRIRWLNGMVVVVLVIALISLLTTLFHAASLLDELFVADPFTDPANFPGRMSEGTAVCFMLLSIALLVYRRQPRLAEAVAILTHFIALLVVFGYLFDVAALYAVSIFSTLALHTAIAFMVATIGLIFAIQNGFIRGLITDNSPAGMMIRRVMPAVLLVPVFFGWIALQGTRFGWYSPSFRLALTTAITVAVLTFSTLNCALAIRRWYSRYQESQQKLLTSEIARIELEKQREVIEMKERFLAMLSHDMRQPVSTIILASDMLITYQERIDEDRRISHLEKIRYQAYNILNLVEDIMLVSQLQIQGIPFNPTHQDIVAVCHQHFQEFADMEADEFHSFSARILAQPVMMDFDEKLMKRLLDNLLTNAVKYSPSGGSIQLTITRRNDDLLIAVSDEGIGIPPESQQALFTLFHRAANVGDVPGYGLGLVIVQQVAQVHNGSVSVESQFGQGTTFTVSLPLKTRFQPHQESHETS